MAGTDSKEAKLVFRIALLEFKSNTIIIIYYIITFFLHNNK